MTLLTLGERIERLDVVIGALDWLLANPDNWTRLTLARNSDGLGVLPTDPAACSWCLTGRVAHDLKIPSRFGAQYFYNEVTRFLDPIGLTSGLLMSANDSPRPIGAMGELRDSLIRRRAVWARNKEAEDRMLAGAST